MGSGYIVGPPASGKSTLMRAVLAEMGSAGHPLRYGTMRGHRFPNGLVIIGRYDERERFPGTDRLSMAVINDALEWLRVYGGEHDVLAEGDRLATGRWFTACQRLASPFVPFYLSVNEATLSARHRARGDNQSAAWLKGRATRVRHLQTAFPGDTLDGTLPPEVLARAILTRMGTEPIGH